MIGEIWVLLLDHALLLVHFVCLYLRKMGGWFFVILYIILYIINIYANIKINIFMI